MGRGRPLPRISKYTKQELREKARDMPYRSEASKEDLVKWLKKYRPEALKDDDAAAEVE